jgi:hypothetical protein
MSQEPSPRRHLNYKQESWSEKAWFYRRKQYIGNLKIQKRVPKVSSTVNISKKTNVTSNFTSNPRLKLQKRYAGRYYRWFTLITPSVSWNFLDSSSVALAVRLLVPSFPTLSISMLGICQTCFQAVMLWNGSALAILLSNLYRRRR